MTTPPQGEIPQTLGARAAALLAEAIRIDTTNPPGNEGLLAEHLASFLAAEGIETAVIPLPDPDSPRAAVWARVPASGTVPSGPSSGAGRRGPASGAGRRGPASGAGRRGPATDAGRPLVLLSHLDVVPAEPDAWTVDPLAGVVGGGFVVGRGALDAKGVSVTHALTLVELVRRGIPLARDVILLGTPDEEAGGRAGAALVAERPDLLLGAGYLLTEGGGILPGEAGAPDVWGVTFTEKTPCWLTLTATGVPGHGAGGTPEASTHRLVAALSRVAAMRFDTRVTPEVAQMFAALASLAPPEDRTGYATLRGSLALDPGFRERFLADPGRAALVRTTAAITMLDGSKRFNVVPAEASGGIDVRLLPGERCDDFADRVRETVDDPAVTVRIDLAFEGAVSPTETPLMEAIQRVAAKSRPEGVVVPRVIAGFTDAHWFRSRGLVAYGFVPRRLRPAETRGVHGSNERVSIENLELGVESTLAILRELDAVEGISLTPP